MQSLLRKILVLSIVLIWTVNAHSVSAYSLEVGQKESASLRSVETITLENESIIHVPNDAADLQQAIKLVQDGGTIEIAGGTYQSPNGGFGMNELGKGFTVRAAEEAHVVLDGGGVRPILRIMNTSLSVGKPIVFEGLTFANGYSKTDGLAGGITIYRAQATFVASTFENNRGYQPSTGGGAIVVAIGSKVDFYDCKWRNNTAQNFGGGLAVNENAEVVVVNSEFKNNRTNVENHHIAAAGGGIHVGNSDLEVVSTTFEGNEAGYVGGAIYAIGTWDDPVSVPRSNIDVYNSTFINNQSNRHPTVEFPFPTEGGAFHAEDQTVARIRKSTFITNQAMVGGAITLYRSVVKVAKSIFLGNQAVGSGHANGFGGAISATSNDTSIDGDINRRPAYLEVSESLIQGRYNSVTSVGQAGGGIYVAGDTNRTYGINGASQMGTAAENRATLVLDNSMIVDTDVQEVTTTPGTGIGAGFMVDLVGLTMKDSMIILADALGSMNSSGGGIAIVNQSYADISNSTIAGNTAIKYGAGLFVQGSEINLSKSELIENEISPGIDEQLVESFGSAIYTAPDFSRHLVVTGVLNKNVISNNTGLPIFEGDSAEGPINDVRYQGNTIYSNTFGDEIYSNVLPGYWGQTVSELNDLVIKRANGVQTDKAQVPNELVEEQPVVGEIKAVEALLMTNDSGDTPLYLGYAWSGGDEVKLNGAPLADNAGVATAQNTGTQTLSVDDVEFCIEVIELEPSLFLPFVVGE
jgi:hypothetical protein